MSLSIASINSGSNGNCYYVGNQQEAVLVDAGISGREIERRMNRLGLSMETIKAIFVSHEHGDHIAGVPYLAKKYQLPVYITHNTHQHCGFTLDKNIARPFRALQPVEVGELSVTAFPKYHDAIDPHSFIITHKHTTVGVFTDIGQPCDHLIDHFTRCHAAFLEANYDDDLLTNGRYPHFLKNRIRSGEGHLSNKQAFELFTAYRPSFMSHLLLSHLSKDNNSPELVHNLFNQHSGGTHITVASRYEASPVYQVTGLHNDIPRPVSRPISRPVTKLTSSRKKPQQSQVQLSLF